MDEIAFSDLVFLSVLSLALWVTDVSAKKEKKRRIKRKRSRGRIRRADEVVHASGRNYHIQRRNQGKFHWTSSGV